MTFAELMYFMLSMVKESTQNALSRLFQRAGKPHIQMSRQAFSKARQKIRREALQEMFQTGVEGSYNEEWERWRGFRLLAEDGSFIQLPQDTALAEYYGGLGPEGKTASALVSLLYDLENGIVADARIAPVHDNERALAQEHIETLMGLESFEKGKELVLFDRGYPSFEFIKSLQDKEIAYVVRAWKGFVREELKGEGEGWVRLGNSGLRAREVRIARAGGETETLITNAGEDRIAYEAIGELYHKRRGIETKYKTVKQRMELENFSGRLADSIKQDLYAMMTAANIMAHFMREANRKVREAREGSGNKYEYRVNVNHAAGVYKDRLIAAAMAKGGRVRVRLMRELAGEIERRVVPVRPEREVPRKETSRQARFHHNHKSNC
jgi:hypothetical protein